MREMRYPGVVPCLWALINTARRLLLGRCLLVLVISGCTMGSQGPVSPSAPVESQSGVSPHDPERADYVRVGDTYCDRSQPANAIICYKRALAGTHQQRTKGLLLLNLGWAYYELGQFATAMASYEQALAMARQEHNGTLEGRALQQLGITSMALGQWTTALAFQEQALAIWHRLSNRANEGAVLTNMGRAYTGLSQYAQAIAAFEQALAMARQGQNRAGERWPLMQLGHVYTHLGRYDQARVSLEQAVTLMREARDWRGEVGSLIALGWVYQRLHQDDHALASLERALDLARAAGRRAAEALALAHLGQVYRSRRQDDHALASLEEALTIRRELGTRRGVGTTLDALGRVYAALGQDDRARTAYEQALVAVREEGDRDAEGQVLGSLMALWRAQQRPRLAIFYGKQAINTFQEIRGQLRPLAAELQESFLMAKAPVYRELAELLLTEGRLLEAQQVLDLLKEEEYLDFVRRDAGTAAALQGRTAWTPEEAVWAQRYATIANRVAALGAERGALRTSLDRTAAEEARLAALEADLTAAHWAFQQFLAEVQLELGRAPLAREKLFHLRETQGLMADLRDLGPGTVALYTLVGAEKAHVLLITPDVQLAREVPLPAAELGRKVLAFREVLEAVRHQLAPPDPRPLAQELYDLLVGPVAADLHAVQARTLLWSLDGVLRYLPLAALHDGERYLIERYALVGFTPASQPRWKDAPQPWRQALGLGVSKAHAPFPALPGVVRELRGIIRDAAQGATEGVLPGTIKLDEAFTGPEMLGALRRGYPVVHIASHFRLQPGDETASFLLLGDGSHLSLAQVKTWPTVFGGVELLTLSACHTATGGTEADGKEVEGFAVLAQRQGAKAVLATLWPVEDASTQAVMQTFYRLRDAQPGLSKAAALQQAQRQLLAGPGPLAATSAPEHTRSPAAPLPPLSWNPQAPYAHPYYWAPFVLMGNWK
jgi:CHAT domain-containing protein/tetratricopeptide (TPR) repeat protein